MIVKLGYAGTGVERYVIELERALRMLGHEVTLVHPVFPFPDWLATAVDRLTSFNARAFFENYPLWARYPEADIYHITSQNLATLMLFRRPPGPTVITVHDIIPWLVRHDPEQRVYRHALDVLFDWLALRGIRRADAIVTDSCFTAQSLAGAIDISRVPTTTVMIGVAQEQSADPASPLRREPSTRGASLTERR